MPARNQKSADPVKAGKGATSDASICPASKPVMGSENEPMPDTSVEYEYIANAEVGGGAVMARGALVPSSNVGTGDRNDQPMDASVMSMGRSPHGVESDPNTGKGKLSEPGNPVTAPFGVAEATGDRRDRGRSLHSSPRTGKPSTWRREAVCLLIF